MVYLRNSLVTPLIRLQNFAREVSEGELDTQPHGTFKAELQALERALTAMVVRLKEKILFSEQKTAEPRHLKRAPGSMLRKRQMPAMMRLNHGLRAWLKRQTCLRAL